MGIAKKLVSAALAFAVAGSQTAFVPASASESKTPTSYNTTFFRESKALPDETPFKVFDIYNAYFGITTTKPAATTTKATTTVTSTAKATTAKPVTTVKPVTTSPAAVTTKAPATSAASTAKPTVTTSVVSTSTVTTSETVTTTTVTTKPFSLPEGKVLKGIDISEFQSDIDWYKVKNSGEVDFAILRAGYGEEYDQKDYRFDQNARNAQAAGMDFGIYWYSYALDVNSARKEAEVCMSMLDGYSFTYPVFFDIEERSQRDWLTSAQFTAIVDTFCSTLEENGYTAGIYSFGSMLETKLYDNVIEKYDIWVAEYDDAVNVYKGDYDIWQYSSTGTVDGIDTIVDLNYCYTDLPAKNGVNPSHGRLPVVTSTTTASGIDPTTTTTAAVSSPTAIAGTAGVNISADNGEIDWVKLKNSGIAYAMIKAAESGKDPEAPVLDTAFIRNVEGAAKNEVPFGVYWHSKALTVEAMDKEAETFIDLLSAIKPEYPVFLDVSDAVYQDPKLTTEKLTLLVETFCSKLEEARFYIGVRGTDKALGRIGGEIFERYDVWLTVDIATMPAFDLDTGITGVDGINVPGIKGGVEFLSTEKNYPSIMRSAELNGFGERPVTDE